MESSAVRPRTYMVVGPPSSGKSSFGTCLSGKADRQRSMKGIQFYTARREDFLEGKPAIFFELPNEAKELSKSTQGRSLEHDKRMIQSFLQSKCLLSVYGIILLESLQEDTIQLGTTLQRIYQIFGRDSAPPILVIMTKSDIRPSTFERAQSIANYCLAEGLPCMLWNNYEGIIFDPEADPVVRPLSEYQFEQQLSELDSHLTNL